MNKVYSCPCVSTTMLCFSRQVSISKGARMSRASMRLTLVSSTRVSSLWMCRTRVGRTTMSLTRISSTREGKLSLPFLPSTPGHLVLFLTGSVTGSTGEGSTKLKAGSVEGSVSCIGMGGDLWGSNECVGSVGVGRVGGGQGGHMGGEVELGEGQHCCNTAG